MTNPNLQSSEFEDSLDLDSFASLENQLRSLPLSGPSTSFDSRMESLFQNETCAFNDPSGHSVATVHRANGHWSREAQSTASASGFNGRSGFVLTSACVASVVVVLSLVVAMFSGADHHNSAPAVGLQMAKQQNDSSLFPETARPKQSDLLTTALLTASSQIVETEREFARSLAVAWEQQTGAMFHVASHVRDLRFSECRQCHRRLSSAWHNEATFQPDVSVCLNCHRVGG